MRCPIILCFTVLGFVVVPVLMRKVTWSLPIDKSIVVYHTHKLCMTAGNKTACLKTNSIPGNPQTLANTFHINQVIEAKEINNKGYINENQKDSNEIGNYDIGNDDNENNDNENNDNKQHDDNSDEDKQHETDANGEDDEDLRRRLIEQLKNILQINDNDNIKTKYLRSRPDEKVQVLERAAVVERADRADTSSESHEDGNDDDDD